MLGQAQFGRFNFVSTDYGRSPGAVDCGRMPKSATAAQTLASVWPMAKSKTVPIETCFEQIEEAITALEDGELPLEDALKRYEQGLVRLRQARELLDRFQGRIDELQSALDEDDDDDDA